MSPGINVGLQYFTTTCISKILSLWKNDKYYVRVNLILGERMSNNESVPFLFNSMIYGNWMRVEEAGKSCNMNLICQCREWCGSTSALWQHLLEIFHWSKDKGQQLIQCVILMKGKQKFLKNSLHFPYYDSENKRYWCLEQKRKICVLF